MSDRELLEMAAKGAGLTIDKSPYNGGGARNDGFDLAGNAMLDWHNGVRWNPLTDDGDALRLAVSLNMQLGSHDDGDIDGVSWAEISSPAGCTYYPEPHNGDALAATRRAIVGCAAELGKTK